MTSARSVVFVLLAASLILAACSNTATAAPPPSPTVPLPTATSTSFPSSTPVSNSTATCLPCDPLNADYCILNAYFVFQLPIAPPGVDTIDRSYPYGSTEGGTQELHHGVEFYNASGTPVLAAAGGTVYYAGDDSTRKFSPWSGLYGNIVVLEHPLSGVPFNTLYTLYAHLAKLNVRSGQAVTTGEKIGEVGLTGSASGSHLHFEVRVDPNDYGATLNPELWLVPHPGNGTLALQAIDQGGAIIFPLFNVQSYPDRNQPAVAAYQVDSYPSDMINAQDPWNEVAALGDRPAGWYRITFNWAGVLHEKWIEILPGKLTRVVLMVK